jgi:hypothetical protein
MYAHAIAHALREILPALGTAALETKRAIFQEIIPGSIACTVIGARMICAVVIGILVMARVAALQGGR